MKKLFLNDNFIFGLISFNAILIFLQGFPAADLGMIGSMQTVEVLAWCDDFISLFFLVEVITKGRHFGWNEYLQSTWNKFDVFLVVVSLPSVILHFIPQDAIHINLSVLLILRVFRVFKFFRFIKFFPQVEHIFKSAQQAVSASFMVLLGFFVFIFIASLFCCYFYRDYAPELFGNPIQAYYSTFQVFTIEGWNSIPPLLEAEAKSTTGGVGLSSMAIFFSRILFIIMFIVGGVFGLSIVNSIFVDAMVSNSTAELEEEADKTKEELMAEISKLNEKIDNLTNIIEQYKKS